MTSWTRIRRAATLALAAAAATGALASPASAEAWKVDPAHTSVLFHVRHLFTEVTGRFGDFEGQIDFDPEKPEATSVSGTIDAASIDTNIEKRDKHLRSCDFFCVEKHPKLSFSSTGVSGVSEDGKTATMTGVLEIRGVEKPVELDVEYLGAAKDPWGNRRAGFRAETTIDRKDFGLKWNEALETGGFLVGDEIRIEIKVEALSEA